MLICAFTSFIQTINALHAALLSQSAFSYNVAINQSNNYLAFSKVANCPTIFFKWSKKDSHSATL